MNRKAIPHFSAIIGVFWLLVIILGYAVTHHKIDPSFFMLLWPFLTVTMFVCLAGGIGNKLWPNPAFGLLSSAVVQVLAGFGAVSILTLALGMIWRINSWITAVYLLLGILGFHKSIYSWLRNFVIPGLQEVRANGVWQKLIFLYLTAIFAIQLLQSLAPALKYDALIYHLTLPRVYLQNERITDIPWLVMSGIPQAAEMLYLNVMAIAGESAALLLNWFFGLLAVFGLFGFLQQRSSTAGAFMGCAALLGGFTLVSSLSWGYVDWLGCLFGLGMLMCLDQAIRTSSNNAVFFCGLFAGLAFSTKYPAGVLFLSGFVTLSVFLLRSRGKCFAGIGRYLAGSAVFAFPWLIKNLILTGNPVYPFFFASGTMDATRLGVYQGMAPYGDLWDLFLLPLRATIQGIDGTFGYSVSLGPLFLGLGLLAFLGWEKMGPERKQGIAYTGILALIGILVWALGNRVSGFLIQTRFYYALFPAFAVLAGYGYQNFSENAAQKKVLACWANGLITLALLFNFGQIAKDFASKQTLAYLAQSLDMQGYLEHNLGWYALAVNEIKAMPEGERVLLIFEPRGYACVQTCDPDEILDHWKVAYNTLGNAEAIRTHWTEAGYTHVLVYHMGIHFLKEDRDPHHPLEELTALEAFLEAQTLEKDYGGVYKLYRLENKP